MRAHSTRGVSSSWALARGASIADICRAAGWATPNTFARFYNLRVERVLPCTCLRWPVTLKPARCQSHLLRHYPLRTGYVCFCCFSVQFPAMNPVEVPPAPSAVRRGRAPDARSNTRVFAQGQPLCWARCPCVVIPLRVIPHVYSSTL